MTLVVQKFGGTSVGDPERIRNVARRVVSTAAGGADVCVAFSASGDAELGEYDDEPAVIFKAGQLPAPFEDAITRAEPAADA